jgi:hypothetical protein
MRNEPQSDEAFDNGRMKVSANPKRLSVNRRLLHTTGPKNVLWFESIQPNLHLLGQVLKCPITVAKSDIMSLGY